MKSNNILITFFYGIFLFINVQYRMVVALSEEQTGRTINPAARIDSPKPFPIFDPDYYRQKNSTLNELKQAYYYNSLGISHRKQGDLQAAVVSFKAAMQPQIGNIYGIAAYNLGSLYLQDIGDLQQAAFYYEIALDFTTLEVDLQTTRKDFATVLMQLGRHTDAIKLLLQNPIDDPMTVANVAMAYSGLRDFETSLEWMLRAITLDPADARMHHNAGNTLQSLLRESEAVWHWKRALELDPNITQSRCSLGIYEGSQGRMREAQEHFAQAMSVASMKGDIVARDGARLQLATAVLPRIYESNKHIETTRRLYTEALSSILHEGVFLPDPVITTGCGSMGYYLIYQGKNDLELRRMLAQIYANASPVLKYTAPHVKKYRSYQILERGSSNGGGGNVYVLNRPLRIGFISGFFYHQSVGLLLQNVIHGLAQDNHFEVIVFVFSSIRDNTTEFIRNSVHKYVELEYSISDAQEQIALEELDILVHSEIGMHSYDYFMAFAELALRSVAFWGHAITSGIDSVDYFVTSHWFQSFDVVVSSGGGDITSSRYSECLYPMNDLSTSFPSVPSSLSLENVSKLLLNETELSPTLKTLYLVPQTLYKIHPDFDRLIDRVLSSDEDGYVVFPVGSVEELKNQLQKRFQTSIKSKSVRSRIFFAKPLSSEEFQSLCSAATVVLDPFPVGGGRSSLEIFAANTPIVLLYPRTSILQLTFGMYMKMGIHDCITYTEDEFANRVISIGKNATYRNEISDRIKARKHVLYNDPNVVSEWKTFLRHIASLPPPSKSTKTCPHVKDIEVSAVFQVQVRMEEEEFMLIGFENEDPWHLGKQFAISHDLEPIKEEFIIQLFRNGMLRYRRPKIAQWNLSLGTDLVPAINIDVHYGDDLYLVSLYAKTKFDLSTDQLQELHEFLQQQHPDYSTREWIAARQVYYHQKRKDVLNSNDGMVCRDDLITLVFTTCKRLNLFKKTVASLRQRLGSERDWCKQHCICKVIVLDDGSSYEDRVYMLEEYPDFEFVLKDSIRAGHGHSMNLLLSIVSTRFVLYVEDDWQFSPVGGSDFIKEALEVLNEGFVQVLLNSQDSSGWERKTHRNSITYYQHEFGTVTPPHSFSYWPGFSLNPGIWDLQLLKSHEDLRSFNATHPLFERDFSLRVYKAGLEVAFLSRGDNCVHIGTKVSAYVLNNQHRPFDKEEQEP